MAKAAEHTRVVGYTRVSTSEQAEDGVSLEAQEADIRNYALALHLDLVGVESDRGFSASTLKRPGLQNALRQLRDNEADGVLVTKLDRLTRSLKDLGVLIENYFGAPALGAPRWSVLSVSDSIDTRTASGRLVLNVLTSVAQWEREAIGERTKAALAHLKRQGVVLGGESLGWQRSGRVDGDGRLEIEPNEEELETVAMILALHEQGHSLRKICANLTLAGRATKRGKKWSPKVVRSVLGRVKAHERNEAENPKETTQ